MLREELEDAIEAGERVFVPLTSGGDADAAMSGPNAALELVRNLAVPRYKLNGFVHSLPCGKLDDMVEETKERWLLSMTNTPSECLVLPYNTTLPLQHHNETTSFSTLLIGSIGWIIWPPTEENISTLQKAYDDFSVDLDDARLDVTSKLVGGVFCVQRAGEGIRIPPYCIILGISTATSVLAKHSILSVTQFLAMLRRIPFLESWWKTEVHGDEKRASFAKELVLRIERILAGEFDDYEPSTFRVRNQTSGALAELVHGWDQMSGPITRLMDDTTAKRLKKAWKNFLSAVLGRECAICGRRVQNKGKLMVAHFNDKHWPKDVDGSKVGRGYEKTGVPISGSNDAAPVGSTKT